MTEDIALGEKGKKMPRLIDTEKLEEYKTSGILELTEWQQGWNEALDTVINEVPTVVKHGHWVDEIGMILCSECGDSWGTEMEEMIRSFNYCPNCGAKMDERKEE